MALVQWRDAWLHCFMGKNENLQEIACVYVCLSVCVCVHMHAYVRVNCWTLTSFLRHTYCSDLTYLVDPPIQHLWVGNTCIEVVSQSVSLALLSSYIYVFPQPFSAIFHLSTGCPQTGLPLLNTCPPPPHPHICCHFSFALQLDFTNFLDCIS